VDLGRTHVIGPKLEFWAKCVSGAKIDPNGTTFPKSVAKPSKRIDPKIDPWVDPPLTWVDPKFVFGWILNQSQR